MKIAITHIDAKTGIVCTKEPMQTGPSFPQVKGWAYEWADESTYPIACTNGVYNVAPLFFGTCADDADTSIVGVVTTYTAEEYASLKTTEHQARKPYPSWIGNEETMTWVAPVAMPADSITNGGKVYFEWDEAAIKWIAQATYD